MVTWLLEKDIFDSPEFKEALANQNTEAILATYIPFGGGIKCKYVINPTFAYGSMGFISEIQKNEYSFYDSVFTWCNFPQFECSYYYPRFGKYLLQQDYAFLPYGELLRRKDWILKNFAEDGCVFIRPDSGKKPFTGYLTDGRVYEKDIEFLGFYQVPPEEMCVVCRPQNILNEWRLVINDKYKVLTGSLYKQNGVHKEGFGWSLDCIAFANEVLEHAFCKEFKPDPFWVLDIGETKDGFSVIEVNSMSCSGLYECDKEVIIRAINEYIK